VTLDEAYAALGLRPPWDWEEYVRERHAAHYPKQRKLIAEGAYDRRIGSSTHMLVELYLDLEKANRTVSPMAVTKIRFVVNCLNKKHAQALKQQLALLHAQLGLYVNLDQVEFMSFNATNVRGRRYPSWGIFCDHFVKENYDGEFSQRATGPYRYIRRLKASVIGLAMNYSEPTIQAYDRDDNLMLSMPMSEVNDVLKSSECPIELDLGNGSANYSSVSYPAWSEGVIKNTIHYTLAFNV
jgi:hypothetical protein